MSRMAWCGVLLALAGCEAGGDTAGGVAADGGAPGAGDTGAGPARGAGDTGAGPGCQTNADCPEGWWCAGPEGCGATWACQPETPCSAAPPFLACTCAGEWTSLNAGCPGERWAYRDDWSWQPPAAACDPAAPFVYHAVRLQGQGFDAWAGKRLRLEAADASGVQVAWGSVELTGPAFDHLWKDVVHVDGAGVDVTVQVDLDGNNNCTAGEPSWTVHVDNPDDYAKAELPVTLDPAAHAPATCD